MNVVCDYHASFSLLNYFTFMLSRIPTYRLIGLFIGLSIASNLFKLASSFDPPAYALSLEKNVEQSIKMPSRIDTWCNKFFKQHRQNIAGK